MTPETRADAAPLSTAAIRDDFPAIVDEARARLEAGKITYGDDSFERPLVEVVAELHEEALDIIGWGFILCARVKHLQRLALEATTPRRPTADAPRAPIVMSWPGGCSAVIGEGPIPGRHGRLMPRRQHWECPECARGYCCAPDSPPETVCVFDGVAFVVMGDCDEDE